MTYKELDRKEIVEELLLEADLRGDSDIRAALLALGSYANFEAPKPNAGLAAMLAGPQDELAKRRWKRKHRAAVVGVAVVGAMGLGVSGVAAAGSGRSWTPPFINDLFGNFAPHGSPAPTALPTPDAPKVLTQPAPGTDPSALPSTSLTEGVDVPAATAPSEAPAGAGKAAAAGDAQPAPAAQPLPAAQPGDSDRPGDPDQPGDSGRPGNAAQPAQSKPTPPGLSKPGLAGATKPAKPASGSNKQGVKKDEGQDADAQQENQVPSVVDKLKEWLKPGKSGLNAGE
ncbi:hypothetical protein AAHB33_02485 [Paenarthrobacter sp. S56]|uniref:hypothetical protein n=1 Tax=Paenarthrobacter sp. S56 TaxID=3138179 RepID=UPI003219EDF5